MTPLEQMMGFLSGAFRRRNPLPDDPEASRACAEHVSGNDRLSPAEQADIYRRQFWMRHVDSLVEDYPGLEYILGEDAFGAFARAYLDAHPPRSPSLRDLGADIVPFAESWDGFPPERRQLCIDMLRYENACVDVFDGPDTEPLRPEAIQGLAEDAWDRARIVFCPTLTRLRLTHDVARLRLAVRAGDRPALPTREEPTLLVVFRKDFTIHFEVLTPDAFDLLDALVRGEPLVGACDKILEGPTPDASSALERPLRSERLEKDVAIWFRQWTGWGWIVDVEVPPRS